MASGPERAPGHVSNPDLSTRSSVWSFVWITVHIVQLHCTSWIFSVMLLGPNEWILENFNENRRNKNNFWLN